MELDKITLKRIYKLNLIYPNGRLLKRKLKEIYDINITQPKLNDIKSKIKVENMREFYKNRVLYMYKNCSNIKKLADYLNSKYGYKFTYQGLVTYCHKFGVKKENKTISSVRRISKDTELEIVDLYEFGFNSYQLADMFGYKTKKSILDILRVNNVQIRNSSEIASNKRSYKDFSFEKIDSYEKAYIIGLLISDGYVNDERNYVGIDLCDEDAISFMSDYINVKYTCIKAKKDNHKDKYRILIYGKEYLEQLKRFGIFARKSLTTSGCDLFEEEERYISYILRGLIDGDGWIREDGEEFFVASASKKLIEWIEKEMYKLGFVDISATYIPNETNGIYQIRTGSKHNIGILKEKVYDTQMGMQRKFDRLHI